jgi:hypothetical protein
MGKKHEDAPAPPQWWRSTHKHMRVGGALDVIDVAFGCSTSFT